MIDYGLLGQVLLADLLAVGAVFAITIIYTIIKDLQQNRPLRSTTETDWVFLEGKLAGWDEATAFVQTKAMEAVHYGGLDEATALQTLSKKLMRAAEAVRAQLLALYEKEYRS